MNRSDFLRKLGIGIGVAVVAPKAIVDIAADKNITPAFDIEKVDKRISEIRSGWYAGHPNYNFIMTEHRLYLANGDFYYETQETFHKNDVLTFGNNDKYVVTSENNGWYFLEKV